MENLNIPPLFFKGNHKGYQYLTLGDVAKEYYVSNKNIHHQNLLSLSYGEIVRKDIKSKKGLLPASFDTYQVIKKDIIVIRVTDLQNDKRSLRVGISTQEGIITSAYISIEPNLEFVTPQYLYTILHYHDDITKAFYHMGDGLRQTLTFKDLRVLKLYIPSKEEQHAITKYVQNLDSIISTHKEKLESLKNLKKACLVKMFPQNGKKVPEVRFKGFEGEWEEKLLGECFSESNERSGKGEMLSVTINSGIMKASELERFVNITDTSKYKVLKKGYFAYNTMRMWQGACGYSKYDGIVSPAYTVLKPSENIDVIYFQYMFKQVSSLHVFRINSQGLTSDTWNLKYPQFSQIRMRVPKKDEQQKIASYFTELDTLISTKEQEIEKLQNFKKACLEKMFC